MDRGVAMGFPRHVRVSYSSGVKAPMVSEHALALLLALLRQLPAIAAFQAARSWKREEISAAMRSLGGATVCVIGLGEIGREIARKLQCFGARVLAVSRSRDAAEHVAQIYPREQLHDALARADAIVLCTQADATSFHMIGETALAHVKRGALLVNVARGSLVDERALIAALAGGVLGGAALDVQEHEPLPPDDPLWSAPNLIVSPHSAGAGSDGYSGYRTVFADNLRRFISGEVLRNEYVRNTAL
jgi:phosphoglycerate dehydrogenase-like enzyme